MIILNSLAGTLRPAPWRLNLVHSTSKHRLILITQGQGRVLHHGQRRGIGPGQVIHVPAKQSFALDIGAQATGHILSADANHALNWPTQAVLVRSQEMLDQSSLLSFLEILRLEDDQHKPASEDVLGACLTLISVWLRRQIGAMPPEPKPDASQKLLTRFLKQLETSYRTGATMAQYAHKLNVTPTHLSRVCKASLGRSAADLILERILHDARTLLADTDRPAKDIAASLGFGSAAYFSRFILKKTGSTPKSLRAEHANRLLTRP